jgi:aminomethyltransferase
MPVKFSSETEEHRVVRASCGLFDISHLGQVEVTGSGALVPVQALTTNNATALDDGQCQYTLLCNPEGGIVDDCIVYRFSSKRFLFCVNAVNTDKVFQWIRQNCPDTLAVEDRSSALALFSLQGPASAKVLGRILDIDPLSIKHFNFLETSVVGLEAVVSRTGYTGEDGFELYIDPEKAEGAWQALLEAGRGEGILPCGLAARDSLRLEMAYPLYGNELSEKTTPIEAGLKNFIKLDTNFIGKETLQRQTSGGVKKRLVGFEMLDKAIARSGYRIIKEDRTVGVVTSGLFSPTLKRAIALGYVEEDLTNPGTEVNIEIRKRPLRAVVKKTPFYRRTASAAAV